MKQAKISNAAVAGNASLPGFPPGLVPNLGKLPPTMSIPEKSWVLQAAATTPPQVNGFAHFNRIPPHIKMQESPHTHNDSKASGNSHSEIGKSLEGRNHLQYWNHHERLAKHAAHRVTSPTSHSLPDNNMLHHNSGNGISKDSINNHLPRNSQFSSHQRAKSSSPSEMKKLSSHHHLHSKHSPDHAPHHTYSPVDLAAESLLSLSGSVPRRNFPFPPFQSSSNNAVVPERPSRQHPKESVSKANHLIDSSPFTKVSQINKLSTSEGYAVFSNPMHVGAPPHTGHPSAQGILPGEKITTPSPKAHVLPTHLSDSYKLEALAGSSHSSIPKQSSHFSKPEISPNGTPPGHKTPERTMDSPKLSVSTPEEEERLRMLSKNEKLEMPKCGCLEHDPDEAPYYTHLGAGPSVPAIRKLMEKRFGKTGKCIRIEKLVYSGKEGKSSQGCPIAKWIIRRSCEEEKLLTLVRNRPGHHCETAYIIIAIVAWEGVENRAADYMYELLRTTLPLRAIPTMRKCATNEEKTCACQGFNPDTCGASFSFGCSWSMYYNACKFARSKTPRKFKLQDSDPQGEESLEAHFQHLAGDLGPLYRSLAPDSYSNQVAFEDHALDCRLGHAEGRPFSGVTACMDFCAHAHRDQQNMNNGATVVVTLTKDEIRKMRPKPGDEQLHILPLYYLDSTDEFGSSEGQQEKVRNGSLEVLTAYRHKSRLRQKPVIPSGAVRPRNSSHDKSSPAKGGKTVANLLASKSTNPEEKKKYSSASSSPSSASSSLPAACYSEEPSKELKKSSRSAFANPKETNSSAWTNVRPQYPPHGMEPAMHPGWFKEVMNGTYLQGGLRPNFGMHPELLNGMRPEGVLPGVNPLPQDYMSIFPQYSPYLPPGYPPMATAGLNGVISPEQLQQLQQTNPHLSQMLPAYSMEAAYLNPYMRLPHYQHMEPVDIKPDPQKLSEMMGHSFGKMFAMQKGLSHGPETEQKYSKSLEQKQSLNGIYPKSYHPSNSVSQHQDAIWRPPIFHKDEPKATTTPINAMEQSVNALPNHGGVKDAKNKHIPCQTSISHLPKYAPVPLKVEDPERENSSPEPAEEEYYSDSEKCFEDPTIGGVAIALLHGSVLFEVAKRELHATSSLITPCRQKPTRISLVFYQHKQLNYKNHGLEMYEKKVEAKKALLMEEGKLPPTKKGQKRPAEEGKASKAKHKKEDKSVIPTKQAVTPFTDTVVTVASYASTKVTGPYQSPPGKSSQHPTSAGSKPAKTEGI